jgi:hypothetical protein
VIGWEMVGDDGRWNEWPRFLFHVLLGLCTVQDRVAIICLLNHLEK